jgi:hypothetical protein
MNQQGCQPGRKAQQSQYRVKELWITASALSVSVVFRVAKQAPTLLTVWPTNTMILQHCNKLRPPGPHVAREPLQYLQTIAVSLAARVPKYGSVPLPLQISPDSLARGDGGLRAKRPVALTFALAAVKPAVPSSAPGFISARAPLPPLVLAPSPPPPRMVLRPPATVEAAADRD